MSNYSFANSFSIGEWKAYTPVWSSTGTQPVFNNAIVNGWYAGQGQVLTIHMQFTFGSTTTFGTGVYSFSLPAGYQSDPSIHPGGILQHQVIPCAAIDSGSSIRMGCAWFAGGAMGIIEDGAADWASNIPFTWAVNDNLSLMGMIKLRP